MAVTEYRVSVPFRGVDVTHANATVRIPDGAILFVSDRQAGKTLITVLWGTREVLVSERDLLERAIELPLSGPATA